MRQRTITITAETATICGRPIRRSHDTAGLSAKLRSKAKANGISTPRPK